jgi:hypothetical protein
MCVNNLYDQSHARVRALGRHSPIYISHIENVGIISSTNICNGRQGRLVFTRPGRDSKSQRSAMYVMLDSKSLTPMTILGDEIP